MGPVDKAKRVGKGSAAAVINGRQDCEKHVGANTATEEFRGRIRQNRAIDVRAGGWKETP